MLAEMFTGQESLASIVLGGFLVALAFVDFTSFRLPNVLNLGLGVSGICCAGTWSLATVSDRFLGVAVGGSVLAISAFAYRKLRNAQGLGLGDVKLLAAGGAWVSWHGIPSVLLIGASTAALYGTGLALLSGRDLRTERVPFGMFLCLGIWTTWLTGPIAL